MEWNAISAIPGTARLEMNILRFNETPARRARQAANDKARELGWIV
jgi:hypothetical protein